jgi:hypothetical protein
MAKSTKRKRNAPGLSRLFREEAPMENASVFESGTELLDALKSGSIGYARSYVGMIKASEKQNHIAFAPASCEQWFDLPANLVGNVQVIREVPCKDHTHPLVKLNLKRDDADPLMGMIHQMLSAASRAGMQLQLGANPVTGATQLPFPGLAMHQSTFNPMQMAGVSGLHTFDPRRMMMLRRNDGPRDPIGCRNCLDSVGFFECMDACNDPALHPGGPDIWCIGYCYALAAACQTGPCAPRFWGGRPII